jgi:hypothetical protein
MNMPKYLVETVVMHRIRYVVDCDNETIAMDSVVMNEPIEFSQDHIDENIFSCREITDEEIPVLYFKDHPYLVGRFDDNYVMENYVHRIEDNG